MKQQLTRNEINYLIKLLDNRVKDLKQNDEIIKKRKLKGLDNSQTYLNNLNNNNKTFLYVKKLKSKLLLLYRSYN